MLRSLLAVTLFVVLAAALHAQDEDPTPLTQSDGWQSSVLASLAASQAAYSNWQEGGINALAFNSGAAGRFERVLGAFKQVHNLDLEFGQFKLDTLAFRKAADLIRYAFALQYQATGVFQPTFALEARSQFAQGFDYNPEPMDYPASLPVVAGQQLQVSAFGSPAYLTQIVGVTYDPGSWYTARFGVGVKETIVSIERLRPVYGNALDESVRVEAGLDLAIQAQRQIMENVVWTSRLGAFQAVNQFGTSAPDTIFENDIAMKVNDFLSVNLGVVTMFDRDVSQNLQFKELLSLGVSFTLL
ncbi:MAG: DUF3078 domain-containing protein [Bacteroidetes bacterium]|nr:DUF3078 domain-containing protein [Bacteroidota bacterium]